jgi:hypothetical protein
MSVGQMFFDEMTGHPNLQWRWAPGSRLNAVPRSSG